eukprot:gnl/Trimastix_PCT/4223.p2 GENE.gnl/Trimastix_PCT/4223~~gnl/Trimastix_PCT/4223.p2  ORF type:complete len:402 (+),score=42.48 gnl/Trimastix_PCT/4223:393-1598(+)
MPQEIKLGMAHEESISSKSGFTCVHLTVLTYHPDTVSAPPRPMSFRSLPSAKTTLECTSCADPHACFAVLNRPRLPSPCLRVLLLHTESASFGTALGYMDSPPLYSWDVILLGTPASDSLCLVLRALTGAAVLAFPETARGTLSPAAGDCLAYFLATSMIPLLQRPFPSVSAYLTSCARHAAFRFMRFAAPLLPRSGFPKGLMYCLSGHEEYGAEGWGDEEPRILPGSLELELEGLTAYEETPSFYPETMLMPGTGGDLLPDFTASGPPGPAPGSAPAVAPAPPTAPHTPSGDGEEGGVEDGATATHAATTTTTSTPTPTHTHARTHATGREGEGEGETALCLGGTRGREVRCGERFWRGRGGQFGLGRARGQRSSLPFLLHCFTIPTHTDLVRIFKNSIG